MAKTLEEHFRDWHSNALGYGYGTGEHHTMPALKAFLANCRVTGGYDILEQERALTPTVAWLLINVLCGLNVIEYGVSPRSGWLTREGRALKSFVDARDAGALVELTDPEPGYVECLPDWCNCAGYTRAYGCRNPFWPGPNGVKL